jgi:uncharacterized peroxidase-related enzyme
MSSEFGTDVARLEVLERPRVAPSSTNLPLVDERTAHEEVRTLFAQYRERFARTDLPGIVLCFATNPAFLKGMIQIAEEVLFGDSLLSRRHKEMIATYVSQQNACPYCAHSHGALLGAQGGSSKVICALQHGDLNAQLFTSAELALLKFARSVNANSSAVTRADVEAAIGGAGRNPK